MPQFERKTGYSVKTISVGTGQALALAARGEADVTLAHAPAIEKKYVDEGKMLNRRLVMYNDFVIIGPEADPAKIKGEKSAVAALKRIAEAQARFVSRGDKSGTHTLEQKLWKQAGVLRPRRGTSSRGRGWAPRWASPTTGRPTRSPIARPCWPSPSAWASPSWWRATGRSSTSTRSWRSTPPTGRG